MRRAGSVIGLAGSIGLAAFLGTAVVAPAPVYAATIVVTTTEDSVAVDDPLLDVLDQSPPSYGLLPGSPAIDAGVGEHFPPTDQRGNDRPVDGDGDGTAVLDIGAVEAREPDPNPSPGTGGLKPTPGELPNTAVEHVPAGGAGPGVTLAALLLVSTALFVMRRVPRQ